MIIPQIYWLFSLLFSINLATALPTLQDRHETSTSRLDKIRGMYGFEGFVYTLTVNPSLIIYFTLINSYLFAHFKTCPSFSKVESDFVAMVEKGARNVITFEYCGDGTDADYYGGKYSGK